MPNKVRLCLTAFLCLLVRANCQNIEHQVVASQFGEFKVPSVGTGFSFPPASCQVTGGGKNFAAFSTSAAVKIVDTNPAHVEVVTPTAVFINSCAVSLAATFPHTDFYLTSGTGGLQEAITNGQVHGTPNTVILDQEWYSLIQPRSASTVIASAQGNTSMGIVDVTTTPYTYYQWSGSAYVVVQISGTGLPLTGGTLSGALIAPEINGEMFPAACGDSSPPGWCPGGSSTADAWIRAACGQLPSSGGNVNWHQLTGTLAASLAGCSSPTKKVNFITDNTTNLTITESDGGIVIPLDNASAFIGPPAGQCLVGSGIHLSSSANVAAVIGPAHTDGTQENFTVSGACIWGVAGAVISKGGVYSEGNFANTTLENMNIFDIPGYGVNLTNSSSIKLSNNWVNSSEGTTYTASPLLIQSTIANGGTGCRAGNINITDGQYEHSYNGAAEINITGDGQGAIVCGVNLTNVGTERNNANGAPIAINVSDCWGCTVDHVLPSGTNGGTDLLKYSQTASGRTQNGNFKNTYVGGVYTNGFNNTVDSPNVVLTSGASPFIATVYVAPGYTQSGAPVGSAGGGLTGTYPNPGLLPAAVVAGISGQPVTPSSVTSKIIEGVSNCAAYAGATPDLQVKACLADAIGLANGNTTGWADARAMTGNLIMASEIDVGSTAGNFAGLLLPCTGTWQASMTGGTAVTLKQFGGAEVVGCPVSGAAGIFYLGATGGSNLYAIYEQVGSASPYIHAYGFNALNSAGHATTSHYTAIVDGNPGGGSLSPFSDGSLVQSVNVNDFSNPSGGAILFRNVCCGYTWADSAFNANGGGTPVTIQADSTSYIQGLYFQNDTMVDPGSGKNAFLCSDTRSTHLSYVSIGGGPYNETGGSDGTTPLYQSNGCSQISFQNIVGISNVGSSTAPLIAVSNTYNTFIKLSGSIQKPGIGSWTYPATVITNNFTGQTVMSDAAGNFGDYVTPTVPSNVGILTANGVTSDGGTFNALNAFSGTTLGYELNGGVVVGDATSNGQLLTDSVTNDVALINSSGSNKVLLGILANHSAEQISSSGVGFSVPVSVTGPTSGAIGLTANSSVASAPVSTVLLTVPTSVTAYALELPGAQPTSGNPSLTCTAANPSVCAWGGSTISPKIENGISKCDQYAGSTADVKLNACIADAETKANGNTSGVADARGMGGAQTFSAFVNCGDTSLDKVTVLMPADGVWTVSTQGSSSHYDFNYYSGCTMLGTSAQPTGLVIDHTAANGNSLGVMGPGAGAAPGYVNIGGFSLQANSTAVITNSVLIITGADNTIFHDLNINHYSGGAQGISTIGPNANGICCQAKLVNVTTNGQYSGGAGLDLEADSSHVLQGFSIIGSSFDHPATPAPNIKCVSTLAANTSVEFHGVYEETNHTLNATTMNTIDGCTGVLIDGFYPNDIAGSGTGTIISTTNASNTNLVVTSFNPTNFNNGATFVANGFTGVNTLLSSTGPWSYFTQPFLGSAIANSFTAPWVQANGTILSDSTPVAGVVMGQNSTTTSEIRLGASSSSTANDYRIFNAAGLMKWNSATLQAMTLDQSGNLTGGTGTLGWANVTHNKITINGSTFSVAGCGTSTALIGGSTAGQFTGGSATCTPVVTMGGSETATNGWACYASDRTTGTAAFRQTASSTTTATFTAAGVVGATDVISFACIAY